MHTDPGWPAAGTNNTLQFLDILPLGGVKNGSPGTTTGWDSIIGIVTALIGNVLISFALNTQRYAHIRLAREQAEVEKAHRSKQPRGVGTRSGTVQEDIAEARAKAELNATWNPQEEHIRASEDNGYHGETEPLLSSRNRKSTDSQSTEPDVEAAGRSFKKKSYLRSPYWWIGIILMTIGEAGNFLAYGFAPASIVSPLGVVALISNCIIAPFMLKERFRVRDFLGIVIAIGGAVTIVLSANDSNPKLGAGEIWKLITTWEFETYLGITITLIVLLMYASNKYGEKTILIDLGLVGLFGGYTVLSTKGVASLLSYTLWKVITYPVSYLLAAVLIGTAIMQIKYVNRALARFDSTQVIPTQFVCFTLSVIIGSAILYRDFEKTTTEDAIMFIAGCALTFSGVWFLTSGREKEGGLDDGHDPEEEEEEDDLINLVDEERYQDEVDGDGNNLTRTASKSSRFSAHLDTSTSGGVSRASSNFAERSTYTDPPAISFTPDQTPSTPPVASPLAEPSPLTDNPRESVAELRHPQTLPSNSTTAVPTLSNTLELPHPFNKSSSTPMLPSESRLSPAPPHTPKNGFVPDDYPATGISYTDDVRPFSTLSRRSIASIMPDFGPLTSPLSASLSAVVADNLRRGVDVGSVRRKARKGLRFGQGIRPRGRAESDAALEPGPSDLGSSPLKSIARPGDVESQGQPPDVSGTVGSPKGRGRSFSTTLTDLFRRSKRQKVDESPKRRGSASSDHGEAS